MQLKIKICICFLSGCCFQEEDVPGDETRRRGRRCSHSPSSRLSSDTQGNQLTPAIGPQSLSSYVSGRASEAASLSWAAGPPRLGRGRLAALQPRNPASKAKQSAGPRSLPRAHLSRDAPPAATATPPPGRARGAAAASTRSQAASGRCEGVRPSPDFTSGGLGASGWAAPAWPEHAEEADAAGPQLVRHHHYSAQKTDWAVT